MRLQKFLAIAALALITAPFSMIGCASAPKEPEEATQTATEDDSEKGAAEDDTLAAEAAPAPEATATSPAQDAASAPAAVPATTEAAGFDGAPTSRFVTSYALNVRSAPSKESPVVGHVKKGDKVEVVINGEWAKIASGKYAGKFISNNRLAETDPTSKAVKAKGKKAKKKKAK